MYWLHHIPKMYWLHHIPKIYWLHHIPKIYWLHHIPKMYWLHHIPKKRVYEVASGLASLVHNCAYSICFIIWHSNDFQNKWLQNSRLLSYAVSKNRGPLISESNCATILQNDAKYLPATERYVIKDFMFQQNRCNHLKSRVI